MPSPLAVFRELTQVPTAPYYEEAVTRKALAWLRRHGIAFKRRRGGVIARYDGLPGQPALALAAHLDHPAFHLKGERAIMQGRLDDKKLDGYAVEGFEALPKDNTPVARGVLRRKGDGFTVAWASTPRRKPAFATLALPACELRAGWVLSRSIDDLFGCALSLETLRRAQQARLKTNVVVLLHRAEEEGFIGALDLIAEGAVSKDDTVLSIETSRELPGARPGGGPVIRLGDRACLFDPNVTALLQEAGKDVRHQELRLTGGTCEATAYLGFGYEAGGLAIPLVNYHNGLTDAAIAPEMVRLSDAEGAVELLLRAAKLFPSKTLRGVLRRRLAKRHAGAVPMLRRQGPV